MIDYKMVQQILEAIGAGEYVGTPSTEVLNQVIGDFDAATQNEQEKFMYHMDEIFSAELFRAKDLHPKHGWGMKKGLSGTYMTTNVSLVLTPIGGEALEEMQKPKGLEKFRSAVRSAGSAAGSEAVKYAMGEMFKSAGS